MRKSIFIIVLSTVIACNTADDKTSASGDSAKSVSSQTVDYVYPIRYSSQFEMGDSKNGQTIVSLWKDFDGNNLGKVKNLFADTVTLFFPGMSLKASRDSVLNFTQAYRDGFTQIKSTVDVVLSTRATDKNEDWVAIWGAETKTDKKGNTDSLRIHEVWRFNKDGKIDYMSQFIQPEVPAKQ